MNEYDDIFKGIDDFFDQIAKRIDEQFKQIEDKNLHWWLGQMGMSQEARTFERAMWLDDHRQETVLGQIGLRLNRVFNWIERMCGGL